MEVRRQGHVRQDGRQVGAAEGLIAGSRRPRPRRDRPAGTRVADDAAARLPVGRRHRPARAPRRAVQAERPPVPWFEVHSENYFADGGPALAALDRIRADYPLSLHGVGLSLGSTDPLARAHLAKLARLIARVEPALVSEHLCWSGVGGRHFNDLLPLPVHRARRSPTCARASRRSRTASGGEIAVENVSAYVAFADATMPEWEFVAAVARRTGCKLLLDVNNIYVNAVNHGFDADAYLAAMPRGGRRRDPPRRIRRERPLPDRHARRARRAGGVGALSRARSRASARGRR